MNVHVLNHRTNLAAQKAALINVSKKEETMTRATISLLVGAMIALAGTACNEIEDGDDAGNGDCRGASCDFDGDDDGVDACAHGEDPTSGCDCRDRNANIRPGASEACNGLDDNCDGNVDEGCSGDAGTPDGTDQDGDGFERCGTPATAGCDCDDSDPTIHPGATDVCDNSYDEDCSGSDCHDGGTTCEADCGDAHSCTSDFCDGDRCMHVPHDDRCGSGQVCDMGRGCVDTAPTACAGGCSDGIACTEDACEGGRCVHRTDDTVCGADARCDVRDGCVGRGSVCRDADCSDGILCTIDACDGPVCAHIPDDSRCGSGMRCDDGSGCVDAGECRNAGDCDDGVSCTNDSCVAGSCRHTRDDGACRDGELCDLDWDCIPEPECTRDDDCRDTVSCTDNFCSFGFCVTDPRDTFCPSGQACDRFLGCVSTCTPVAEACDNGRDDDCDGQVDEGCGVSCTPRIWYRDSDTDTFGDPNVTVTQCTQPAGYVDHDTDCRDNDRFVNPDQTEECGDGIDNDCSHMGRIEGDAVCPPTTGCEPGLFQACYSGSPSTRGVGICRDGSQRCESDRTWGACTGSILPTASDICGNTQDDDCDGALNDGCGGGSCTATETSCTGGVDEDCDGQLDCADADCAGNSACPTACSAGATRSCHLGCESSSSTNSGTQTCSGTGSSANWGTCTGSCGTSGCGTGGNLEVYIRFNCPGGGSCVVDVWTFQETNASRHILDEAAASDKGTRWGMTVVSGVETYLYGMSVCSSAELWLSNGKLGTEYFFGRNTTTGALMSPFGTSMFRHHYTPSSGGGGSDVSCTVQFDSAIDGNPSSTTNADGYNQFCRLP